MQFRIWCHEYLCTDKTGTLTEDKIILEKYLNTKGEEDIGVLKYAYLNSSFQTGLRSNIDEVVFFFDIFTAPFDKQDDNITGSNKGVIVIAIATENVKAVNSS